LLDRKIKASEIIYLFIAIEVALIEKKKIRTLAMTMGCFSIFKTLRGKLKHN